eukprot:4084024-Amphidinium_carterae.1
MSSPGYFPAGANLPSGPHGSSCGTTTLVTSDLWATYGMNHRCTHRRACSCEPCTMMVDNALDVCEHVVHFDDRRNTLLVRMDVNDLATCDMLTSPIRRPP